MVWCNAEGPDDAFLVVALLNRNRHHASDADTVAAHQHHMRLTLGIEVGCIEEGAILRAELKDVPQLATAYSMERAATMHAGCAIVGGGDILPHVHTKVTRIVHILDVIIFLVRTRDEVIPHLQR